MAKETTNPLEGALQHGADSCEAVAKVLEGIGAAAKRVLNGPLEASAVCLLVREAMPRGAKSKVSVEDVYAVLVGASRVGEVHLKAKAVK